tara:strand:- start:231 stop:752 length:522 start_codon:yes stop_codon:yes gene_type:complete
MPVTINGNGTITGISAGGLPDGCITADDLASGVGGKILQVVSATSTTQVSSSSASHVDTGLSCSITTTSASSKVYVAVSQSLYVRNTSGVSASLSWDLVRGSTVISDGSSNILIYDLNASFIINKQMASFVFLDSPASAATHTYKTTAAASSGEWRAQDGSNPSHIVLMEIEA